MTGTLPSEVFHLPSLEKLRLRNNTLQGSVNDMFNDVAFERANLAILDLSMNNLTGKLPGSLFSSRALRELYFGDNQLMGTIPAFNDFNGLYKLYLNGNDLSGSIPESISTLSGLTVLNISSNRLDGTIPPGIGQMTSLERLDMNNNMISGSIPYQIENLGDLRSLDGSRNRLNGTIPDELGMLTDITAIDLSRNDLSGTVPSSLAALENLVEIQLNINRLTGTLSADFSAINKLLFINIANNTMRGSLEEVYCEAGRIPRIVADCDGEVECSCCQKCCNSAGGCFDKEVNFCGFQPIVDQYMETNINRDTECNCVDENKAIQCQFVEGQPCESCNTDESICTTVNYAKISVDTRFYAFFTLDFEYTKGYNHSVNLWLAYMSSLCAVSIDGTPCESCEIFPCGPSGQRSPRISCKNIDGINSTFDGCAENQENDVGIYSFFHLMNWGTFYSRNSCEVPNVFDNTNLFS